MAETDPSVLLAMFRDRAEDLTDHDEGRCADPQKSCTGHDALRMADALDAVLKQAGEWEASAAARSPLVRRGYAAEVFRAAVIRGLTGEATS
jgi:hypothetical protein